MRRTRGLVVVALAAAALSLQAAQSAETPGVSANEVVLGGTVPLSGPESAFGVVAAGADAYFKYVNARGGVNGRKIRYVYVDDAYDPAQTVQQTRRLVEQDKVFAIFNSLGTEQAQAVKPYLNQLGVPQLFVGSGAATIGREYKKYPWTIGYLPNFAAEGSVFGRHLAATKPGATIAVLSEASEYGRELVSGLERGLGAKRSRIVARETYNVTDPDVSSQIAKLRASNANTLILFALPKQVIQSYLAVHKLGWRPQIVVASVSIDPAVMQIARLSTNARTTEGSLSLAYLKDPTNTARWGKDAGVRLYQEIMRKHAPGADPKAVAHLYGMAVAFTMVDTLRRAGRNLTRQGLLRAATSLDEKDNPFLLPGIVVKTTPTYRFPITQVQLFRVKNGRWTALGPLLSARPS